MAVNGKGNIILQLMWVYSNIIQWKLLTHVKLGVNVVLYEVFSGIWRVDPFMYVCYFSCFMNYRYQYVIFS
jgi:hypothetical protein